MLLSSGELQGDSDSCSVRKPGVGRRWLLVAKIDS